MKIRVIWAIAAAVALAAITGETALAAGATATERLAPLIELLKSKGVVNDAEAARLLEELKQDGMKAVPVEDPAAGRLAPMALSAAELQDLLDALEEQGLLTADEALLLARRPGEKGGADRSPQQVVAAGSEAPFVVSSLPEHDILNLVATARDKGVVTPREAGELERRYRARIPFDAVAGAIREEVRSDTRKRLNLAVKEEVKGEVKEQLNQIPKWARQIRLSGDLRLRYQADLFNGENTNILEKPDKPGELMNTTTDRQRFRIRARLGATAQVNDQVEAALRLATGTTTDPVSTNATLGDGFNKKTFLLDQAYVKWTPLRDLTIWGGRVPNPWFATDLVWDNDLNFDGVAASYAPGISDSMSLFFTGGAFPLQEIELSQRDKWLLGGQAGVSFQPVEGLSGRIGVAYYHFANTTGELNEPGSTDRDFTAPASLQKGNTLFNIHNNLTDPNDKKFALASDFRELNATASLDIGFWDPIHFVLMADYVRNLGFDKAAVAERAGTDVEEQVNGFQFGLAVGYPALRETWDWKTFLVYKRLEADAVMDAFTDSDFHLGGTNAKGWTIGGEVALGKNVTLGAKWMTADEVSADRTPQLEGDDAKLGIDVFQLDLSVKF